MSLVLALLLAAHPILIVDPVVLPVDPGLPYDVSVRYLNRGGTATGVFIDVDVPEGSSVLRLPSNCSAFGTRVRCEIGTVTGGDDPRTPPEVTLTFLAPDRLEGGFVTATAVIGSPDFGVSQPRSYTASMFRTFVVDSTAGSGAGSLRSAIETANAACLDDQPCKVAFRFPEGETRLTPERELPPLSAAHLYLDATTQTRRNGGTIVLDGSRAGEANGVVIGRACSYSVEGFAIRGFARSGVLLSERPSQRCDLPYFESRRIEGNTIAANERGIVVDDGAGSTIAGNVINGNRRSGIFVNRGFAYIRENTIGLDAARRTPMPNGGSGVYVGAGGELTDISGNMIAFNHEFGVAIQAAGLNVDLHPNSIFANWQAPIDIGLDGPTPPPVTVDSALYDAERDRTVIDLHLDAPRSWPPVIHLYAADAPRPNGTGEAQYYLGVIRPLSPESTFRFAALGDWRGKWISATFTQNDPYPFATIGVASETPYEKSSTSELCRAVQAR